ncbi:MAG: ribose 5-phosphate isomerase B [Candidatus Fonsibacter sp.]
MTQLIIKKIYLASDHAGFDLKEKIKKFFKKIKIKNFDLGCFNKNSVDYPDYAKKVAYRVNKNLGMGLVICGSGIGMSISANRFKKVRAALCYSVKAATLARKHNNANVLCLGARLINFHKSKKIVKVFFSTVFEGGRHIKRVEKLDQK